MSPVACTCKQAACPYHPSAALRHLSLRGPERAVAIPLRRQPLYTPLSLRGPAGAEAISCSCPSCLGRSASFLPLGPAALGACASPRAARRETCARDRAGAARRADPRRSSRSRPNARSGPASPLAGPAARSPRAPVRSPLQPRGGIEKPPARASRNDVIARGRRPRSNPVALHAPKTVPSHSERE